MMKQLFFPVTIAAITTVNNANAQTPAFSALKIAAQQLDDVMELTDTTLLKTKLAEVEKDFLGSPAVINKVRLGIIYHETALNLSFFSKTAYKGYAEKSFDILTELFNTPTTGTALMPFIAAYRASALSLVGAEKNQLKLLRSAFSLFADAVEKYSAVSYLPEFLRGSVAENLPWFFITKRKYAKKDFSSIIAKHHINAAYADNKVMSFTYYAWVKQHKAKKYKEQAIQYLETAIKLDPDFKAGRAKAAALLLNMKK